MTEPEAEQYAPITRDDCYPFIDPRVFRRRYYPFFDAASRLWQQEDRWPDDELTWETVSRLLYLKEQRRRGRRDEWESA
jgi:hypothetical protein